MADEELDVAPPVDVVTTGRKAGWCMTGQHAECQYMACGCQECPGVHHTRMSEMRVVGYGETVNRSLDALSDDEAA